MSLADEIDRAVHAPGGDPDVRCMALAHGATTIGRFDAVEAAYALALRRGVGAALLTETALQTVAYGGFPQAIEGLGILARLRADAGAAPTPAAAPAPAADEPASLQSLAADGRRTWDAIYSQQAEAVLDSLAALAPELARWVLEDAYGRILSRPGLPLGTRELLAVCSLALLALPAPLGSHIRGALRNGSSPRGVDDILRASRLLASPRAQAVIDQALDRLTRKVYQA